MLDIEQDFQGLDLPAWNFLKQELAPLLNVRDEKRGWQPLFDKMNQAKAFNYLKRIGCVNIEFIPPSPQQGKKTPDLQAMFETVKLLCEVKTINVSEIEAVHRLKGTARGTLGQLDERFFKKLNATLITAKEQIDAYCSDKQVRRVVYFVLNFDDNLHEYGDIYLEQINQYITTHPMLGVEAIFDAKPAFYTATAN